jgi:hypothetical protein
MENTLTKDVLILGLISGEKLLCEVTEQQGAFLCSNILEIITDTDQSSGQMRMGLMPYMPYSDTNGGLAVPSIMATVAVPNEELLNHYKSKFGMLITPPEQKIFLG